jgi:hypothetical protein
MMSTLDAAPIESRAFEADVSQLLQLMVHSVYSDREVFPAGADLECGRCVREAAV